MSSDGDVDQGHSMEWGKGTDSPNLVHGQVAQEEEVVLWLTGALAWPDEACSPKPVVAWSLESEGILCGRTWPIYGPVL